MTSNIPKWLELLYQLMQEEYLQEKQEVNQNRRTKTEQTKM